MNTPRVARIGQWYSQCCWEDLSQIETEEDRADVQEMMDNGEIENLLFDSKDAALAFLSEGESEENLARIAQLHGWKPSRSF